MTDKSGIFDNGGSAILTGSSNTRSIKSFGGSTYILQAASGTPGTPVISLLSPGSPSTATTSVTTTGITPTAGDSNALDFAMVSSGQNGSQFDTLYYTDNTGIFKYADVSGTWTAEGEITGATSHLSGITAAPDPVAGVDLYVTYTNGATNRLEEITDATAYNASATTSTPTITTLYTAPANDLLRGVSFGPVPVPEPVSLSFVGVGVLGLLGRPRRKAVTT